MPSEGFLKRIEALNGGPLANPPSERTTRSAAQINRVAASAISHSSLEHLTIELLLEGAVRQDEHAREYYEVVRPVTAFVGENHLLSTRVQARVEDRFVARKKRGEGATAVFLDLETLGLRSEPLFLIGLLETDNEGALYCRQLLARDLSEEAAIIQGCAQVFGGADLIVTFNGELFDLPFLRRRAASHGIPMPRVVSHYDVLAASRMRLAGQVRYFRLKTLERHICGRRRCGDIPGGEIPRVYSGYQQSGDATKLVKVLEHNALDLISTADLFTRLS
jgi:uncharacterized protein YprB with RNaseH-like and TPR domain